MAMRGSLNFPSPSHCFFGFEDLATALINYGQLRKRERIVRAEFCDFFRVRDGIVKTSQFLQMDAKRQMCLHMARFNGQNMLQGPDTAFQIALVLERASRIVELFRIRFGHMELIKVSESWDESDHCAYGRLSPRSDKRSLRFRNLTFPVTSPFSKTAARGSPWNNQIIRSRPIGSMIHAEHGILTVLPLSCPRNSNARHRRTQMEAAT